MCSIGWYIRLHPHKHPIFGGLKASPRDCIPNNSVEVKSRDINPTDTRLAPEAQSRPQKHVIVYSEINRDKQGRTGWESHRGGSATVGVHSVNLYKQA